MSTPPSLSPSNSPGISSPTTSPAAPSSPPTTSPSLRGGSSGSDGSIDAELLVILLILLIACYCIGCFVPISTWARKRKHRREELLQLQAPKILWVTSAERQGCNGSYKLEEHVETEERNRVAGAEEDDAELAPPPPAWASDKFWLCRSRDQHWNFIKRDEPYVTEPPMEVKLRNPTVKFAQVYVSKMQPMKIYMIPDSRGLDLPEDLDPHTKHSINRHYGGEVVGKEQDGVIVRWYPPDEGGPPKEVFKAGCKGQEDRIIPLFVEREGLEPRDWWDGYTDVNGDHVGGEPARELCSDNNFGFPRKCTVVLRSCRSWTPAKDAMPHDVTAWRATGYCKGEEKAKFTHVTEKVPGFEWKDPHPGKEHVAQAVRDLDLMLWRRHVQSEMQKVSGLHSGAVSGRDAVELAFPMEKYAQRGKRILSDADPLSPPSPSSPQASARECGSPLSATLQRLKMQAAVAPSATSNRELSQLEIAKRAKSAFMDLTKKLETVNDELIAWRSSKLVPSAAVPPAQPAPPPAAAAAPPPPADPVPALRKAPKAEAAAPPPPAAQRPSGVSGCGTARSHSTHASQGTRRSRRRIADAASVGTDDGDVIDLQTDAGSTAWTQTTYAHDDGDESTAFHGESEYADTPHPPPGGNGSGNGYQSGGGGYYTASGRPLKYDRRQRAEEWESEGSRESDYVDTVDAGTGIVAPGPSPRSRWGASTAQHTPEPYNDTEGQWVSPVHGPGAVPAVYARGGSPPGRMAPYSYDDSHAAETWRSRPDSRRTGSGSRSARPSLPPPHYLSHEEQMQDWRPPQRGQGHWH